MGTYLVVKVDYWIGVETGVRLAGRRACDGEFLYVQLCVILQKVEQHSAQIHLVQLNWRLLGLQKADD